VNEESIKRIVVELDEINTRMDEVVTQIYLKMVELVFEIENYLGDRDPDDYAIVSSDKFIVDILSKLKIKGKNMTTVYSPYAPEKNIWVMKKVEYGGEWLPKTNF